MTPVLCGLIAAVTVIALIAAAAAQAKKQAPGSATAIGKAHADSQLVCPHCQTKGKVTTQRVKRKKGLSGGKATGAILTGGLSLPATGLSRKEWQTDARCGQCQTRWSF